MWQTNILNWFASNKWSEKIQGGLKYLEDGLSGIFVRPIHSNLTLFMEHTKSKLASTECGKMPPNKWNVTTTLPSPKKTDKQLMWQTGILNWLASNKWSGKIRAGLEFEEDGLSGIFVRPIHSNLTLFMEHTAKANWQAPNVAKCLPTKEMWQQLCRHLKLTEKFT